MNNVDEFVYISALLSIYEDLLTIKQKNILEKYYFYNLSLGEIAEELNISRSAVLDSVEKGKLKLLNYETTLHIKKKIGNIQKILDESDIDENVKKKILKEIL